MAVGSYWNATDGARVVWERGEWSRCRALVSCATGVTWTSHSKAYAMKTHRDLVDTVLALLRQARTEIAGDHVRELADSLDKAIALLESLDLGDKCGAAFLKVLEVLGKGFAAINAILQFIDGK
jgi:hypothetical protein